MNEIYWITRLESLNTLFTIITVISSIAFVVAGVFYLFSIDVSYMEKENKIARKSIKFSLPSLIISSLLLGFTPTTKEALLIWGVGGTIEYLKSNNTAKQLPDKCIQALDKLMDEYLLEDNKEENK